MRWVIWIFALFALAVGAALALRFNAGYALLVWPPYRVELSLNLLALLLICGFAVGYFVVRSVAGALGMPARVREFRARRRQEAAQAGIVKALRAFFEGRYARAEKEAASVIEADVAPVLGAVIAARAAHERRRFDERDRYLARAEELAPQDAVLRTIATAEMLLDQRRYSEALTVLKALPEKRVAVLRLELKAQQQTKNWERAVQLIDQLERRGALEPVLAAESRRYAYVEHLKRKALDSRSLAECWQKIPAQHKRDPRIAATAARCMIAVNASAQAQQVIETALEAGWDADLVTQYGLCDSGDALGQIELAERWLPGHPRDAALLLALGTLCARQRLWGKAQSYLEESLSVERSCATHRALAELQDQLGNTEAALRHYRQSLELALADLKAVGVQRRS